jgi:hypothetical protein
MTGLKPPAYPPVVKTDEDRERFDRLYHDLVYVLELAPAEALLQATAQFQLGFDAQLFRRKRRKKVHLAGSGGEHVESPDDVTG